MTDIAHFVVAAAYRQSNENRRNQRLIYSLAQTVSVMQAINLNNAFSKRAKTYPTYEEIFGGDNDDIFKRSNTEERITEDNKFEFYHKQKLAYEKMGVKFE